MQYPPPPPQHYEWFVRLPLAQFIRIPPGAKSDPVYDNLVCTEEDQMLITTLILTLSESNPFTLIIQQEQLRKIGEQINHVHPFKFLGTIFSNPRLKLGMRNVMGNIFKAQGFLDGLAPSLTREASKGKLLQYLDKFAEEVGVDSTALKKLYENKNWSGSNWTHAEWEKIVWFLIES